MILKAEGRYLEIIILRRSHPECTDFEDGNWLEAEIKIAVPGFKGCYGTNLRTDDFGRFNEDLERLKIFQSNEIEFTTMEEGLYIKGKFDMSGNIQWIGTAKSLSGDNNLTFSIRTDYGSIDDLLTQTQDILNDYPVVGILS